MMISQGLFITFEGGEGSGKSTQVQKLANTLREQGRDVMLTREPGGTEEAERIRALLVQSDGGQWSPLEEVLLLFAARAHHVRTLIKPAVESGSIVICDRFTDSTRAYQGYGLGLDLKIIESIKRNVLGDFEPDITFLLDIPASDGLKRSTRRLKDEGSNEDKYENLDIEFHEKLRAGFLELAEQNQNRFCIVDALQEIDTISAQILQKVKGYL
ncbi:MAG: dTMP kinase [Alphaproteobacteria bacterium]